MEWRLIMEAKQMTEDLNMTVKLFYEDSFMDKFSITYEKGKSNSFF